MIYSGYFPLTRLSFATHMRGQKSERSRAQAHAARSGAAAQRAPAKFVGETPIFTKLSLFFAVFVVNWA